MIDPGKYAAVVVPVKTQHGEQALQFGHSSKKKTPQVVVAFEILRGPQAGKVMSWIGYFTEASEDRTLEVLRTCGFTGADLDDYWKQRPENEVEIVVEHEEGDRGRVVEKVAWVNAPRRGFVMTEQLQDKELKKFGSRFKAKLKTMPDVVGTKAKREEPSAAPAGGGRDEDEDQSAHPQGRDHIPF